MSENSSLQEALKVNSHASDDPMPQPDDPMPQRALNGQIDALQAGLEAVSNQAESDQQPAGAVAEQERIANLSNEAEAPKRRRGAPKNNQNNFRHGLYSKALQQVKRGKLRGRAKRLAAETLAAVLEDQGDLSQIPTTLQWVCERFSKRVGRLRQMERAIESLIERNPQVKDNGQVLAKLNGYIQPLEDATINDARLIGFVKKIASSDPLRDYIEANYSNGKDNNGE
jgi:hypothetical protein